jgi:hypothetical protein
VSLFDEEEDQYLDTFLIWPVERQVLELEIEQWRIFVEWNALYESGRADVNSHPGHGGRNARRDEIEALLKPSRTNVPASARRAVAQLCHIDREVRYASSGRSLMLLLRTTVPNPSTGKSLVTERGTKLPQCG